MSSWKPEDPRILEDKIKSENKFVAKYEVINEKIIFFTESEEFEYQKYQPQGMTFFRYSLPSEDDRIKATPGIINKIENSEIIKNNFNSENPFLMVEEGAGDHIKLQSNFYRALIETSEDVAEKRWIQNRWFNFLLNLELGDASRNPQSLHLLREESGYLYKKAQDFLMSSSTNERTEILENLSSRL